jgi:hypothetical protein
MLRPHPANARRARPASRRSGTNATQRPRTRSAHPTCCGLAHVRARARGLSRQAALSLRSAPPVGAGSACVIAALFYAPSLEQNRLPLFPTCTGASAEAAFGVPRIPMLFVHRGAAPQSRGRPHSTVASVPSPSSEARLVRAAPGGSVASGTEFWTYAAQRRGLCAQRPAVPWHPERSSGPTQPLEPGWDYPGTKRGESYVDALC